MLSFISPRSSSPYPWSSSHWPTGLLLIFALSRFSFVTSFYNVQCYTTLLGSFPSSLIEHPDCSELTGALLRRRRSVTLCNDHTQADARPSSPSQNHYIFRRKREKGIQTGDILLCTAMQMQCDTMRCDGDASPMATDKGMSQGSNGQDGNETRNSTRRDETDRWVEESQGIEARSKKARKEGKMTRAGPALRPSGTMEHP